MTSWVHAYKNINIWTKSSGEASVTLTKIEGPLEPEVFVCVTEAEP